MAWPPLLSLYAVVAALLFVIGTLSASKAPKRHGLVVVALLLVIALSWPILLAAALVAALCIALLLLLVRDEERIEQAKDEALDALGLQYGVTRGAGEPDVIYRIRIMRVLNGDDS